MDLLAFGLAAIASAITYFVVDTAGSAKDLADKLDYSFNVKDIKYNGFSFVLTLDFILKNPTEHQIKFSYPLVMLYIKKEAINADEDEFIAQNPVKQQEFTLQPYSNVTIPDLTFEVSLSTILKLLQVSSKDFSIKDIVNSIDKLSKSLRENVVYKLFVKVNGIEVKYKSTLEGLGYSPVSAIERPINDCSKFDKYFKKPQGKTKTVSDSIEAENTVDLMIKVIKKDAHLIKDFSERFRAKTVKETSKKIFDFVYNCLKYNIEKGEQLKNPLVSYDLAQRKAREFYKQNGYYHPDYSVDCDDISIFIGSILYNLGIPFNLRLAGYSAPNSYQHVYIVAVDHDGSEIIIDPVYWKFNEEKTPVAKKDIPFAGYEDYFSYSGGVTYLYGTDELGDFWSYAKAAYKPLMYVVAPWTAAIDAAKQIHKEKKKENYAKVNEKLTEKRPPSDNAQALLEQYQLKKNKNKTVYLLVAGGLLVPVTYFGYKEYKQLKDRTDD